MQSLDIAAERLANQHLSRPSLEKPYDVVRRLGAVQAQDYPGSLWAVGLRTKGATEADVEGAIAGRSIVRTWPMRGTLHFVPARDARWMLRLLTPRVVARSAARYRQLELDERTFARCGEVFARALRGGKSLTRAAMYGALEAARIPTAGQRGIHVLSRLAQDGLICFGAREGRQQTFALLEEWVPASKTLSRGEALAELAGRYFESHGPATLRDFAWWSGLTTADAREGLEAAGPKLLREVVGGQTYWLPTRAGRPEPRSKDESRGAHLLPAYDEYTVAYRDRGAALSPSAAAQTGNGIFRPVIVVGGRVVGTWRRALGKGSVVITPAPLSKLNRAEARALASAANRYGEFLGAAAVLS
ncbi:MAG TPA: winged helix DNA-binding domain-containing protein [Pyrinomonadaceae bacterium]|nr:winged helix DNA-binding domain-containing protein [Pyrinomonadaceae bacterium]